MLYTETNNLQERETCMGVGADNPALEKTLVTKSEEAIAGYFSW
jgi:hypothetical protein